MTYTVDQKRAYQREWMQKRRQDWIDSQGGRCNKCGSTENLEIDHIDRLLKTMAAANIWSRAEHVREKELANCQVLCYDCHLGKTIQEKTNSRHGDLVTYQYHKCRCKACKEANAYASRLKRFKANLLCW